MVPLDITVHSQTGAMAGFNMQVLWEILLIAQVICVWLLFPILIVYYESNENDVLVCGNKSYKSIVF